MSENINKLVDEISSLTLLQAADLAKELQEKLGVTPMSMAAPAAAPAAAAAGPAAEQQTEFDVVITDAGAKKLNVIKEIRKILPDVNLTEAKNMLNELPKVVKSGVPKEEADKAKADLAEAGATVEVK